MLPLIKNWFHRYFGEPELAILWFFLVFLILAFSFLSKIFSPVLVAIVLAYLLKWPINILQKLKVPRLWSVLLVYFTFITLLFCSAILLGPILFKQLTNLVSELPDMAAKGQTLLMRLPLLYPDYVSHTQIQDLIIQMRSEINHFGQWLISIFVFFIPNLIAIAVYLILVPMLVYFFLIDQKKLLNWVKKYLPHRRRIIKTVWAEVYANTGNYVRGKVLEMVIVAMGSGLAFSLLGLQYSLLLGVLVGVSVIIPYIGAVVVTIPVVIIAFLQWGISSHFLYLVIVYGVIQIVDANVLIPFLFSEVVNLHPIAIIIAVLFFGGLLGFWGIFFAIPLASVVNALLHVLPTHKNET